MLGYSILNAVQGVDQNGRNQSLIFVSTYFSHEAVFSEWCPLNSPTYWAFLCRNHIRHCGWSCCWNRNRFKNNSSKIVCIHLYVSPKLKEIKAVFFIIPSSTFFTRCYNFCVGIYWLRPVCSSSYVYCSININSCNSSWSLCQCNRYRPWIRR